MVFALGACGLAEAPFVYVDQAITNDKQKGELVRMGMVRVCYHDPDLEQARALAVGVCKEYGLLAFQRRIERDMCKLSAPNRVTFRCYDPKMRFQSGVWVNPFNKQSVHDWRIEQATLTGKPISEIYAGPIRDLPDYDDQLGRQDDEVPMKIGE